MKKADDECLQFVVTHYKQNKLNTQRALARFKLEHPKLFDTDIVSEKKSIKFWILTSGIAAVFMLVWGFHSLMDKNDGWETLRTQTETLQFVLPDRSSVLLYPHSALFYQQDEFQGQSREVRLEGKATFTVEKDTSRPFIVIGKLSKTKVLGTQFTVDESRRDTAFIQVQSGKVAYSSAVSDENGDHTTRATSNHDRETTLILNAGMRALLIKGKDKPQLLLQPGEQTEGNFIFDNTPLDKVLAELSQYYGVRLSCKRTGRRLTARFDHQPLDAIISFIEKVLNVTIKIEEK